MKLGTLFKHRNIENLYGIYIGKTEAYKRNKIYIIKQKRWLPFDEYSLKKFWIEIE